MSMHEAIENAIAEAVGEVVGRDDAACVGFVADVRFADRLVRIGGGTVQTEMTALTDMADVSVTDDDVRESMGLNA